MSNAQVDAELDRRLALTDDQMKRLADSMGWPIVRGGYHVYVGSNEMAIRNNDSWSLTTAGVTAISNDARAKDIWPILCYPTFRTAGVETMSNVLADAEMDRRLAAQPPQDEGITLSLDHDECCRLFAILLDIDCEAGLGRPYEALAHYFDHHEGGDKYHVTLDDFCIKLGERE